MRIITILILLLLVGPTTAQTYTATIATTKGDITVKLYDRTPLHRDNFIKLAKDGFYEGVLFHRVIPDFMIQAGDPNSKNAKKGDGLGNGDLDYTLPSEFVDTYYHKKGALAAARTGDDVNPERRSSASQFYITVAVVGRLNGKYTIFGEVISGQKVADGISTVGRDNDDRPHKDIRIKKVTINEAKN